MNPHDTSNSSTFPVSSAIRGKLILLSQATKQSENMRKQDFFFLPLYKTTPRSLKGCQKAYPDFSGLYSTSTVIHTCALCTSVTTSPQDISSRGIRWEQVSSITTSRAKKMNHKHESATQRRENSPAVCQSHPYLEKAQDCSTCRGCRSMTSKTSNGERGRDKN